jgi:hypothetical protein
MTDYTERVAANAETIRSLRKDDVVLVTTRGSKRSITRRGEVEEVRDFGGTTIFVSCFQRRYAGTPGESYNRFSAFPDAEKIEVVSRANAH